MSEGEKKYSFNVPLPKASQFDPTTQVTVRADQSDEFENSVDKIFGEGTFKKVVELANQTISSLGVEVAQPEPVPVSTATPKAPAASGSQETFGSCPQCGVGQIVKKFKRGTGEYWGRGCNRYSEGCAYMLDYVSKR